MNTERLSVLNREIERKKKEAVEACLDDPRQRAVLGELSELVAERISLTGQPEDLRYLYCDDHECYNIVAGFIGDDSRTVDRNGEKLLVGDVVSLCEDGRSFERMVLMSGENAMLDQEMLDQKGALLMSEFSERFLDSAAACAAFTVTLHSCMEDYTRLHARQTEGMILN